MQTRDDQELLIDFCLMTLEGEGDDVARFLEEGGDDYDRYVSKHPNFSPLAKTKSGHSLLYYAARAGNLNLVKTLVNMGANLQETYDGKSLRDLVQEQIVLIEPDKRQALEALDNYLMQQKVAYKPAKLAELKERLKTDEPFGSQNWIRTPLRVMNYSDHSEGYCNGVSHMGIQAMLIDERDAGRLIHLEKFSQRTEALHDQARNPQKFLRDMEEAHHKNLLHMARINLDLAETNFSPEEKSTTLQEALAIKLTEDEQQNLEHRQYLDGVEVYQQPHKHPELFVDKIKTQSDLDAMNLTASKRLEAEGGMAIVDHFTAVYDHQSLQALLKELKKQILDNGYQHPVALDLGSNKHSISIGFDPLRKEWIFIDANAPRKVQYIPEDKDIPQDKVITDKIMEGLFAHKTQNKLLMSANIFSSVAESKQVKQKVADPLRNSDAFKATQKITRDNLKIKDTGGVDLAAYAKDNGDTDVLDNIKQYEKSTKGFISRHKKGLITIGAVALGGALIAGTVLTGGLLPVAILAAGITTGIGIALVAGIGYGAMKLYKRFSTPHADAVAEKKNKTWNDIELNEITPQNSPEPSKPIDDTTKKLHQTFFEKTSKNSVDSPVVIVQPFNLSNQYSDLTVEKRKQFLDFLATFPTAKQENFLLNFQSRVSLEQMSKDNTSPKIKDKIEQILLVTTNYKSLCDMQDKTKLQPFHTAFESLSNDRNRRSVLESHQSLLSVEKLEEFYKSCPNKKGEHELCEEAKNAHNKGHFHFLNEPMPEPKERRLLRV